MSTLYAESSAVLRWLLGAPGAEVLQAALQGASSVVTSALTATEVERTLRRLVATGAAGPRVREEALGRYSAAAAHWSIYAVTSSVLARAGEAFPVEPLRTLDAAHVATALLYARDVSPLTVLSTDDHLRENARALGLAVAP